MTVDYDFLILPTACWWTDHCSLALKQQAQNMSILWNIKPSWDWPAPLSGAEQSQGSNLKMISDLFVGTCLIGKMMMPTLKHSFHSWLSRNRLLGCAFPFRQPCWKGVPGFPSNWEMGGTYHLQGSPQLPQWCCMRSWILCPEAWEVE